MYSILIADDELWMRKSVRKLVEEQSEAFYVAGEACHGADALEKITRWKPDIVLADIRMPGLDGLEMLRSVNRQSYRPAVIFMSGYSRFDYAQEAVNLGAVGYLLKPVSEERLFEAMRKAVRKIEGRKRQLEFHEAGNYSELCRHLTSEALEEIGTIFEEGNLQMALFFSERLESVMNTDALTTGEVYFMSRQLAAAILNLLIITESDNGLHAESFSYYQQLDRCKSKAELFSVIRGLILESNRRIEERLHETKGSSISAVKKYIDTHYMEELSLDKLAEIFHFHPAYVSALFREHFGESFISYLTSVRIRRAKELLRMGERTAAVAELVGYRNAKYFARVFRKAEGMSPKEYRER